MEKRVEETTVPPGPVEQQGQVNLSQEKEKPSIVKKFPSKIVEGKKALVLILGSVLVILAGVTTGWFLSGGTFGKRDQGLSREAASEIKRSDTGTGLEDESLFPDQAEGKLVEGGIENEGTHHLERPGGISQNVYVTSTVIDLQSFVGKEVKVWGETISGQKAGWLMDVGKVRVIE